MKYYATILFALLFTLTKAQVLPTGSFVVNGDSSYYYPVVLIDSGWSQNIPTQFTISLSNNFEDSSWNDSIIATFSFHVTDSGIGASFISSGLKPSNSISNINTFVGGYADGTLGNTESKFIIWFKGGGLTYFYKSNYALTPIVYDGVHNPVPFQETNGPLRDVMTAPDTSLIGNSSFNYFNNDRPPLRRRTYVTDIHQNFLMAYYRNEGRIPKYEIKFIKSSQFKSIKS